MKFLPLLCALLPLYAYAQYIQVVEKDITVDGDLKDWDGVARLEGKMVGPTFSTDKKCTVSLAQKENNLFVLTTWENAYRNCDGSSEAGPPPTCSSNHLTAALGIAFKAGPKAELENMGNCPNAGSDCDVDACKDYMVDVLHWELGKEVVAPSKVVVGDKGEETGDGVGNLDDEWSFTPHCRGDDGFKSTGAIPSAVGTNHWSGAWSHTASTAEFPFGTKDATGEYIFEAKRPFASSDTHFFDAVIKLDDPNENLKFAAAFWTPFEHATNGWSAAGHVMCLTGPKWEWLEAGAAAENPHPKPSAEETVAVDTHKTVTVPKGAEVVVSMEVPADSNFRVAAMPCKGDVSAKLVLGEESLATMSPVQMKHEEDNHHDHGDGAHSHNKFHVAAEDEKAEGATETIKDEKETGKETKEDAKGEEAVEVIIGKPLGYSGLDYSSTSKTGTIKLTLSTSKSEGSVDVFWTTQNDKAWPFPNLPEKKAVRLKEHKDGESFTIEWDAATATGDAGEVTYGYFAHSVSDHNEDWMHSSSCAAFLETHSELSQYGIKETTATVTGIKADTLYMVDVVAQVGCSGDNCSGKEIAYEGIVLAKSSLGADGGASVIDQPDSAVRLVFGTIVLVVSILVQVLAL